MGEAVDAVDSVGDGLAGERPRWRAQEALEVGAFEEVRPDLGRVEGHAHQRGAVDPQQVDDAVRAEVGAGEQPPEVVEPQGADHDAGEGAVGIFQGAAERDHLVAPGHAAPKGCADEKALLGSSLLGQEILAIAEVGAERFRPRSSHDLAVAIEDQDGAEILRRSGAVEQHQILEA